VKPIAVVSAKVSGLRGCRLHEDKESTVSNHWGNGMNARRAVSADRRKPGHVIAAQPRRAEFGERGIFSLKLRPGRHGVARLATDPSNRFPSRSGVNSMTCRGGRVVFCLPPSNPQRGFGPSAWSRCVRPERTPGCSPAVPRRSGLSVPARDIARVSRRATPVRESGSVPARDRGPAAGQVVWVGPAVLESASPGSGTAWSILSCPRGS